MINQLLGVKCVKLTGLSSNPVRAGGRPVQRPTQTGIPNVARHHTAPPQHQHNTKRTSLASPVCHERSKPGQTSENIPHSGVCRGGGAGVKSAGWPGHRTAAAAAALFRQQQGRATTRAAAVTTNPGVATLWRGSLLLRQQTIRSDI